MHHYQRRRTSITGLGFELRKVIEIGRLVGVVTARLVRISVVLTKKSAPARCAFAKKKIELALIAN